MKTLTSFAVITITGALLSATNTFAGDVLSQSVDVRSKVVTFYDLDLAKSTDAQTLLDRIQRAAKNVCRKLSDHGADLYAGVDRNRCIESSYRDTVAQIDNQFNINIEAIAGMTQQGDSLAATR